MGRTADSTSSTSQAGSGPRSADWIEIGRIVGAHGLRGQLRLRYHAADPEDLTGLPAVQIAGEDGDPVGYEVARIAPGRPGELRVRLVGLDRREDALALRGRRVLAEPRHLREPADGEYYGHQLVGCRVETETGRVMGTVTGIWSTGGPGVLVIDDGKGREHLVPAADELLLEVDVAGRRIVLDAIPGLFDPENAA